MSEAKVVVARPSVVSLMIRPRVNGEPFGGPATGFIVSQGGTRYLITNRHVVRGRHNDTDENMHPSGAWPDEIGIWHNAAGQLGLMTLRVEPLYDGDPYDGGVPRWLEHPQGPDIDVVALELTSTDGIDIYEHEIAPAIERFGPLAVTAELYIVGFPFGVSGGLGLAVWARGSIATEPIAPWRERPAFLIDSRTRPGQSGSPVIRYSPTGVVQSPSAIGIGGGPIEELVGVYSGRINDQSDLGIVWLRSVITDILQNGQPGSS